MKINITSKRGTVLETAGKRCEQDIHVTIDKSLLFDEYDGACLAIPEGYTVTIQYNNNNAYTEISLLKYSLDGGTTWTVFSTVPTTIESVSAIMFGWTSTGQQTRVISISKTSGSNDGTATLYGNTLNNSDDLEITADTTLYVDIQLMSLSRGE